MGTLTNSEDPDEMTHNAAFRQYLHCYGKKIFGQKSFFFPFFKYNLTPLDYVQWTIPNQKGKFMSINFSFLFFHASKSLCFKMHT